MRRRRSDQMKILAKRTDIFFLFSIDCNLDLLELQLINR